ncbi:MAG: TonB-dependent receptor domain-containing protein [Longimicrobiales bacterium]
MRRIATMTVALLALPLLATSARAQTPSGVIQGRVLADDTGAPLAAASVVLRQAADSAMVVVETTDPAGFFRARGLAAGRYLLETNLLGYAQRRVPVALASASDTVRVDPIRLGVAAIALEGVTVEGERAPMVIAADRTIYSTDAMPVASGGVATDVLRSVPELEVDIDGAVTLRGTTPQIYLNGRPAPMEDEALNVFLQQFPADRIARVEVIPNPSARFDAEGSAGIVNIVLKENVDLGLSGSVFLNGGTRGDVGGGGRLAYQRGPLTLYGGSFLRRSDWDNTSFDLRQNLLADPTTFLQQATHSERQRMFVVGDVTAEYEVSERALIWAEGRVHRFGSDSEGLTRTTHMDFERDTTELYARTSIDDSQRMSGDVNAGFRFTFQPRVHVLDIELESELGGEDEDERVITEYEYSEGGSAVLPAELTLEDAHENERDMTVQVDYVRPLSEEGQIELGYEAEYSRAENDRSLSLFADDAAADPTERTLSGFEHRELFNSLYLTVSRNFGDLAVQLGARAERADTRFETPDGEGPFEKDYASFFPSANIRYQLGDGRQLGLSYSRRIRRPSPRVLDPLNRSTDPLNRYVGNPFIDPQYTHSLSLDGSWTGALGTLRMSPYYRHTVDDWAQIKTVDSNGVSTVTWQNLASTRSYGLEATGSMRQAETWNGYISVSGDREERDASNLDSDYSGSSFRLRTRANVQARLTRDLSVQGMVSYTPARDVPQGRISSRVMTHLGIRQSFLDDRASVNIAVMDPFDLFDSTFETRDPTHTQIGRSDFSMRSAYISFSYSFGRPPEDARQGGDQEMADEGVGEQVIRE